MDYVQVKVVKDLDDWMEFVEAVEKCVNVKEVITNILSSGNMEVTVVYEEVHSR